MITIYWMWVGDLVGDWDIINKGFWITFFYTFSCFSSLHVLPMSQASSFSIIIQSLPLYQIWWTHVVTYREHKHHLPLNNKSSPWIQFYSTLIFRFSHYFIILSRFFSLHNNFLRTEKSFTIYFLTELISCILNEKRNIY